LGKAAIFISPIAFKISTSFYVFDPNLGIQFLKYFY
jgi:hypothetical protein